MTALNYKETRALSEKRLLDRVGKCEWCDRKDIICDGSCTSHMWKYKEKNNADQR